MATDPDGDSQMASSPESSLSPSDVDDWQQQQQQQQHAGTRTPTRPTHIQNPHSQFAGVSELSPPGSQTQTTAAADGMGRVVVPDIGDLTPGNHIPGLETGPAQGQPGASWMNKRAQEEYQRALESVVDHDFNLDEFGDPFDERDMKEKLF